jgi:hypothetical protein
MPVPAGPGARSAIYGRLGVGGVPGGGQSFPGKGYREPSRRSKVEAW